MNKHTARRKRRRANATIKFGKTAVRPHRRLGGRTGHIHAKQTPAKASDYFAWLVEADFSSIAVHEIGPAP